MEKKVSVNANESIFWISYLVNGGYNGINTRINAYNKINKILRSGE